MPVDRRTVEAQLEALGDFHRFFTSKEIRYLPHILTNGERIRGITSGLYETKTWIIVITNVRLLFLDKGMFYGLKQFDMPISQISGVSHRTGLIFGEIEVSTSAGTKKIGSITKKDVIKLASIVAGLVHGPDTPAPPMPLAREGRMQNDLATQLERLAVLKEKGALTEDEFTRSKARLIGADPVL